MKKLVLEMLFICSVLTFSVVAEIVMPVVFRDGMVMQREAPLRVFGQAADGALITVRLNGQKMMATAKNGKWIVTLKAMPAGGPYELQLSGDGSEIMIKDVMLGEVWVAGGQSNMGVALASTIDFEKYLPADGNSQLRFVLIPRTEFGEIDSNRVTWEYFNKNSVRRFSAVAYFFAVELQKRLGVTVGVIGSYRGATNNDYWMTPESIQGEESLKYYFEKYEKGYSKFKDDAAYEAAYQKYLLDLKEWRKKGGWSYSCVPFPPMGPKSWQRPGGLYNTMIKPLQPYTIKGCIWYQGEGNSNRSEEFRTLFPAFVEGWRKSWLIPDMPFYFVQLPGFNSVAWPEFRQSQLYCAQKIKNCGMIVPEGCGDENDIHPKIKKPIGDRLAIAISAEVYGQKHIPYGPMFKSVKFGNGKAELSFQFSGSGLLLKADKTESFEIAGADKVFVTAGLELKGDKLLLWSDKVKNPKYVRYAYSPNPDMVLFNKEGLPASPFTTE
ncbi:MAG: hypothetical protein PF904_21785 [Kiritimatiellae bacterium]|jgi:sialate O-acetylesterase|nr:hypothetical protein [Kiritimatiellia bacterium]